MVRRLASTLFAVVAIALAADPAPTLEGRALIVLKRNCVRCHGGGKKFANLDLTSPSDLAEVVTPGKPEESRIIELIEAGKMPMGGTRVPAPDLATLKAWITAGAKMPVKATR